MSEKDFFSSDEEDYEPEFNVSINDKEELEEDVVPEISVHDKIESQKKLDKKNEIKQKIPDGIKLFSDLEDRTNEALGTFTNLSECTYGNKLLGSSGQGDEYMSCECSQDWNGDENLACNDDDCINRGTKIECINGHSTCGDDCSNQRFQKKQYAPINVIQTAKKGYGVRTEANIEPDTFIYEYIGEVIDEKTFKKRMIEYDQLHFKHFYFMMLQKNEFIDATRKGCLARFCNHSCNPNCYVEKWVVGKKLKMGILAKRKILKGEEVTFDYNVDRYGANAQPCYCGEPNCIGFIGGKTQTEAASLLPQFISEALGSTIEDEQEFLKEKQANDEKIVKNDNNMNTEFINSLVMKPIDLFEVNKVMGVLLQCEESLIAEKLIERIELSTQQAIQYKLSYAHGYTSFGRLLKNYYEGETQFKINDDLVLRILRILSNWPKVSKTYIQKVEIVPTMEELIQNSRNKEVIQNGRELLDRWSSFEEFTRIKKSDKKTSNKFIYDSRRQQRNNPDSQEISSEDGELLDDWYSAISEEGKIYYYNGITQKVSWNRPTKMSSGVVGTTPAISSGDYSSRSEDPVEKERVEAERRERDLYRLKKEQQEREYQKRELEKQRDRQFNKQANDLQRIIANAKKMEQEKLAKEKELIKLEEIKRQKKEEYKLKMAAKKKLQTPRSSTSSVPGTPSGVPPMNEAVFNKQWSKFFAQYVPNMLKKYIEEIGHDNLKLCAKDISKILVEKEHKKDSSKKPPNELESEKRKKVGEFTKAYMDKFLIKYRAKHNKRKHDGEGADEHHNGGSKKTHT